MKRIAILISCLAIGAIFFAVSCKKDSVDSNLPTMKLTPVTVSGKSGQQVQASLDIVAPYGVSKLLITKTINLVPDTAFGTVSVTPESTGDNTYHYTFTYTYQPEEVDKLVGINFHFEDSKGNVAEKDLTVNTTASAAQTIYSHKWKPVSILWTSVTPQRETLTEDCQKDYIFTYNADSTMSLIYGALACPFCKDCNIYDKWYVSDDEKTFTDVYHSVFTGQITTEVYNIQSLTKDKWVMDIALDLTLFGYSDHEVFVYTYQAE